MRSILLHLVPLALAANAAAQSFNVDLGANPAYAPVPPAAYGGAIGQTGVWNSPATPHTGPTALVDLAGNATAAVIQSSGFDHPFQADGNLVGGYGDLLEDWYETDSGTITIRVDGLAPGDYEVTTYANVLDCSPATAGVAVSGASEGTLASTGQFGADHVQGVTHVRHRVALAGGPLLIQVTALPSACLAQLAACNGVQITKLAGSSSAICSGDGTGTACPCGNSGALGRGCANSFAAGGALLAASGFASVASDTLVLTATSVSNSAVTFFQGSQAVNGGAGAVFGDGLRCAGGTTIRLGSRVASANAASYPGPGDLAISVRGLIAAAGGTRIAQVWYRNAASFCTVSTFNTTNGVRTTWIP